MYKDIANAWKSLNTSRTKCRTAMLDAYFLNS